MSSGDDQAYEAPKLPWWVLTVQVGGYVKSRPLWKAPALAWFWVSRNAYRLPGYGPFYRTANKVLHRFGFHWFRCRFNGIRHCSWCGHDVPAHDAPLPRREG